MSKITDLKVPLPYQAPDITPMPALASELSVEGSREIMDKLDVDSIYLARRDTWNFSEPEISIYKIYEWKTQSALLPYQGAFLIIKARQ